MWNEKDKNGAMPDGFTFSYVFLPVRPSVSNFLDCIVQLWDASWVPWRRDISAPIWTACGQHSHGGCLQVRNQALEATLNLVKPTFHTAIIKRKSVQKNFPPEMVWNGEKLVKSLFWQHGGIKLQGSISRTFLCKTVCSFFLVIPTDSQILR